MTSIQQHQQLLNALQWIALLLDCNTDFHKKQYALHYALNGIAPPGWVVAEDARSIANAVLSNYSGTCNLHSYGLQSFLSYETALLEIASYGIGIERNDGICPYGCDCPSIAQKALGVED